MLAWYYYILISAAMITVAELFTKKVLEREHALAFSTTTNLFKGALGLFLLPFALKQPVNAHVIGLTYIISLLVVTATIYQAKAIRHTPVSIVFPLTNLSGFFVLIFAMVFLSEMPTAAQLSGIFLLIAGSYILEVDKQYHGVLGPFKKMIKSRHMHFLLLSLIILGIAATSDKYIITELSHPFTYLFYLCIFNSINFTIIQSYRYGMKEIKGMVKRDGLEIFVVSMLTFVAMIYYLLALSLAFVSLVIPLKRLSTLFTTIIGGRLFKEQGLVLKIIGCIIMIAGAALIAL